MRVHLSVRLFASYALVVVVGALTAYLTVRLLAPRLFDHQVGMMRGRGMMSSPGQSATVHSAFASALNTALLVGVLASAAVAGVVAAVVTRRLLRPLDAVRTATRRIAAGQYDASVPPPREPELAALADDVNTLAGALADTETRRTRLLGDVAHEMRTPLTALDGYVEGLIDGVFAATSDNFAAMGDELRRLHRLADDLSTLSRTEEQRLEMHRESIDVAEVTARVCTRLRPQFDDAGVTLELHTVESLPASADPDRVAQVLSNLLGNALRATPYGGRVTVTGRRTDRMLDVTVSDTGEGLRSEDLDRVFERFYRAPSRNGRSPGSGVGLTIARGIARASGGDLVAASAGPGRGATFRLTLPMRAPAEDEAEQQIG